MVGRGTGENMAVREGARYSFRIGGQGTKAMDKLQQRACVQESRGLRPAWRQPLGRGINTRDANTKTS